jgi:Spy/CpxP family protein refolding chaperone
MMTQFRKHLLIGIAAFSLGTGAFAVHAAGPDTGRKHDSMSPAEHRQHMQERMAKRQAELHDKLNLSAAQEPAWKTFTDRMNPGNLPARPDNAEMANLSAPERMERRLAMMREGEKRMADRLAAVKEFYAVLTPEQQKIFNDEFAQRRHHPAAR